MSTARALDRVLRRHFQMHVAWVPGVTAFALGDYGLWRGGVFVPLGNVREFGAEIEVADGGAAALDFVSEDARVTAIEAGAKVATLSDDAAEAALAIELPREQSFVIKCPALRSTRIANAAALIRTLHAARRRGAGWRLRYKIVGELFTAEDLTLLATQSRGTSIELRGQSRALKRFYAARIDASLAMSASRELALRLTGVSGPLGLGLLRVNIRGIADVNFGGLRTAAADVDAGADSVAELVHEDAWDRDPDDDDPDDGPRRAAV